MGLHAQSAESSLQALWLYCAVTGVWAVTCAWIMGCSGAVLYMCIVFIHVMCVSAAHARARHLCSRLVVGSWIMDVFVRFKYGTRCTIHMKIV